MADASSVQETQAEHVSFGRRVYKGVKMFVNEIEEIQTMNVKDDDIFVCTFPRSGTTFLQEMVYLIVTLDFDTANSKLLGARVPFLDLKCDKLPYIQGIEVLEQMKSPRMIKTHLHHFLLPEQLQQGKGKIIYSVRNPKDSVISLYKLFHWINELERDSFDDFVEEFINGTGFACPWTRHVLEYWNKRNDDNVLFLKYEDISKDRPATVRTIAKFLGRALADDDVQKISDHCSIDNMRNNKMTNWSHLHRFKKLNEESPGRFINKGKLGGWHEVLTDDQSSRIDKMIDEVEQAGLKIAHT
ncbi:hypothetical protein ACF0H5_015731 [Mactra antiquata]